MLHSLNTSLNLNYQLPLRGKETLSDSGWRNPIFQFATGIFCFIEKYSVYIQVYVTCAGMIADVIVAAIDVIDYNRQKHEE